MADLAAGAITKSGKDKRALDQYETPIELCHAICARLKKAIGPPVLVLEPSAGHGNFVAAVRATWPKAIILANELAPMLPTVEAMAGHAKAEVVEKKLAKAEGRKPRDVPPPPCTLDTGTVLRAAGADQVLISDFTELVPTRLFDLIIGNPPFRWAEEHVRHGLSLLHPWGVLDYLMPLSFFAGSERSKLYEEFPLASLAAISGRPSFTGCGTGSQEYGEFSWRHGHVGDGALRPPLRWKEAP